jgi:large subunit ribosomal protein L10
MSKKIKQMEMDALTRTFTGVRDLVVLSVKGVDSQTDNKMRLDFRKKKIRMQVVKNSLARKVFTEMGINLANCWEGPTTVAWGANSVAELSRTIDEALKKSADKFKDKVKVKTAVADGEELTFAEALVRPTREQAIADLLGAILGPAMTLLSQIGGPGGQLASQIQTISEKKEEAPNEKKEEAPAPPSA